MSRQQGQAWEAHAEAWLQKQGLKPVCRNWHCRAGEIDLIMRDGETTVFIEVRYRRQKAFGSAAESVHPGKQRKLALAASHWLQQHPADALRFDVITLDGPAPTPRLEWIQNAFENPLA